MATVEKTIAKKNSTSVSQQSALHELFIGTLKDIYWAEKNLVKALPKMQKASTSGELAQAFESHFEETNTHVARLEQVFELLGKKAQAKKCDAMEGLIREGKSIIEETDKGTATRDVGLILAAQKIEHYEIASYGGMLQLSKTLGLNDVGKLLEQTLLEEKTADEKLTTIAEHKVNYEALNEQGEAH